eukprot:3204582-Heterocapsa_arctica.AAC.1
MGSVQEDILAPKFDIAIEMLHANMEATASTPLVWHKSSAFTIPKQNGKERCKGQRLLHSLDSFGKSFFSAIVRKSRPTHNRDYATGYLKHRRREQA